MKKPRSCSAHAACPRHRRRGGLLPTKNPETRAAIDEVSVLRDRACACKAQGCGDAVVKDIRVWFDTHQGRPGSEAASKDVVRKAGLSEESKFWLSALGDRADGR